MRKARKLMYEQVILFQIGYHPQIRPIQLAECNFLHKAALTRIGHLNLEALPVLGAAEPKVTTSLR